MTSRNPAVAQFIVPRLCARLRHQAVEVSFVDLPKVFQATALAGRHTRSDRASRICFCQEHDHGDHGGGTQYRTRGHIMTSRNPAVAQFIVPSLCACPRHRAVEVSFVDLPKVFQATTRAGRHTRSDRASRICFCQEHDHGDHGGGTQYRTRGHIMTSRTLWPLNS